MLELELLLVLLPMPLLLLHNELLPGARLTLEYCGIRGDDERILLLRRVEELAVGAEAGRARAPGAAVPLVEPDEDADYPGDADEPPGDGAGEDGGEGAVAGLEGRGGMEKETGRNGTEAFRRLV